MSDQIHKKGHKYLTTGVRLDRLSTIDSFLSFRLTSILEKVGLFCEKVKKGYYEPLDPHPWLSSYFNN